MRSSLVNIAALLVMAISTTMGDSGSTGNGTELLALPEAEHNISSILCIIKFCEKYFRSEKAVIGSLVIVNIQNTTEFHSQLIIMLNEKTNYDMGVMTKDARRKHGNPAHVVDKAKNYFVVFSETNEVTDAINQWNKLPTWNPLAQVVALFVHTYEDDELMDRMTVILREFLHRKLFNVNVISYRYNADIVQTHTWYPYEGANCADDVLNIHLIEECVYSDETPYEPIFTVIEPLKRKIPFDLHGCELRIAASVTEPFVFYDAAKDAFDIGTEVLMTRTIAQALRMQPKFLRINETRENRVVSNETGIYSLLLKREADILIGGMDRDKRVDKLLWITIPYIQDDQTWCVATARPRDIWRNIFGIYTWFTWFLLIAAIFFIAAVIHVFMKLEKRPENYAWTLMVGMAAALGQTATYEPWRASIRVLMCFLFMYGLVMTNSFNSFLISVLTRPRLKTQIDNVRSAINAHVEFTGGEVALSHYLAEDEVSTAVRENFHICNVPDECLKQLITDVKLAVAVSRMHAQNSPAISQSELFCFARSANIYSYSVAMPIKLDFHLLPHINRVIRQLFEFGLIERWNKLSQSIASNAEIAKTLADGNGDGGDNLVVLTVAHIMGAILIMIFGHCLALIVFAAEHMTYRKIRSGNRGRFWAFVHKVLLPDKKKYDWKTVTAKIIERQRSSNDPGGERSIRSILQKIVINKRNVE